MILEMYKLDQLLFDFIIEKLKIVFFVKIQD